MTTLAMITGHCTCVPCARGDETCSRTGPCEACKATMRVGESFMAAHPELAAGGGGPVTTRMSAHSGAAGFEPAIPRPGVDALVPFAGGPVGPPDGLATGIRATADASAYRGRP